MLPDRKKLQQIRLVAFDVDGVFTDGRFYLSDSGEETKSFHTQDGYGIRRLIDAKIDVAIISGRKSMAVETRMRELGVPHVILGCGDKVAAFDDLISRLELTAAQCAYAGDDLPDLPLLRRVGVSFAVANAVSGVRDDCDYTTVAAGGFGAVREISDLLIEAGAGK